MNYLIRSMLYYDVEHKQLDFGKDMPRPNELNKIKEEDIVSCRFQIR